MSVESGVPGLLSTASEISLVLDTGIRNFVLIPILFIVLIRTRLVSNIGRLVSSKPKLTSSDRILHSQSIRRSKRTRDNCHWITRDSYYRRRRYLTSNLLAEVKIKKNDSDMPGGNVDDMQSAMSMMKGNTVGYIANVGFMIWINSFFAGFILLRLPFTVTETLRPLVQRDAGLVSFDCSYVSSLCWYFITMFGVGGLQKILQERDNYNNNIIDIDLKYNRQESISAGPNISNSSGPMGSMPGMGANPMMPGAMNKYDPNPMLSQERNEINITKHEWLCKDSDKRLLAKWIN